MTCQSESILAHLKTGKTLTPLYALREWGCFRLAARIFDLREAGNNIHCANLPVSGKIVGHYTLLPAAK